MKPQVRKTALAKLRPTERYDNRAIAPALVLGGIALIGALFGKNFIGAIAKEGVYRFALGMAWFLKQLIPIVNQIFLWLGGIAANLINIFSIMNPFDATTMAPFLWNTFKNIAYVVLIFLSLYAGFKYIIGNDREAKNVIFKILVIALLINFSFLIAKEVFLVSHVVTTNLACLYGESTVGKSPSGLLDRFLDNETKKTVCNQIGTAIHTSLLAFMQNTREGANAAAIQLTANTDDLLVRTIYDVMAQMMVLVLFFIYTIMLFIFAGLFVGRFVIITFLAGLLPVAVIMWALPGKENTWKTWLSNFLTWTYNIPLLLILVLVGFSVVSIGLGGANPEGGPGVNFAQTLAALTDPKIINANPLSKDDQNSIQLYAGLIRFFFIVVYYGFAISFAQSLGGNAAKFSVQLATGAYLGLGAATVAGGRGLFGATVRQPLGNALEKWGEKGYASRLGGMPVVGGFLQKVTETGKKLKETPEDVKKRAEAVINQFEDKPENLLKEVAKGRYKKELGGEVITALTKKFSKEQFTQLFDQLDEKEIEGLLGEKADKHIKAGLVKHFNGDITSTKASDLSDLLFEMNARKMNIHGLRKALRATGRESLLGKAVNQTWSIAGRDKRKALASNLSFVDHMKDPGKIQIAAFSREENEDFEKGLSGSPLIRAIEDIRDNPALVSLKSKLDQATPGSVLDLIHKYDKSWRDKLVDEVIGDSSKYDSVIGLISARVPPKIKSLIKAGKWAEAREEIFKPPYAANKDAFLGYMDCLDLTRFSELSVNLSPKLAKL